LNTTSPSVSDVTVGTVVSIRVTSPSGESYTRESVVDENLHFDNSITFDEPGRWTVEYSYTDENGQVVDWGEAVDVQEEEDETPSAYEAGVIFAVALIALIGMILSFVARQDKEAKHEGPGQGLPPGMDQPVAHDSVDQMLEL